MHSTYFENVSSRYIAIAIAITLTLFHHERLQPPFGKKYLIALPFKAGKGVACVLRVVE
jgi:hypothetical protein